MKTLLTTLAARLAVLQMPSELRAEIDVLLQTLEAEADKQEKAIVTMHATNGIQSKVIETYEKNTPEVVRALEELEQRLKGGYQPTTKLETSNPPQMKASKWE